MSEQMEKDKYELEDRICRLIIEFEAKHQLLAVGIGFVRVDLGDDCKNNLIGTALVFE